MAWREFLRFLWLSRRERRLVFYSEGRAYGIYFQSILDALRERSAVTIVYLSSDPADPMLGRTGPNFRTFMIGVGAARTLLFRTLQADVVVLTTPSLQTYHLKRSTEVGRYVYVHHSIVSTHMAYEEDAFDHFDAVFCVGPHHVAEIRAREAAKGLVPKQLVKHGYAPVDMLLSEGRPGGTGIHVLVAPSWGPNSLLESEGIAVCRSLLDSGLKVSLRPHSRSVSANAVALERIAATFAGEPRFCVDWFTESRDTYRAADLIVSDWSGAAFEFAFGLERPALFIDVPPKMNNPRWRELGIEPLESALREIVGRVVAPEDVPRIGALALELVADAGMRTACAAARNRCLFNVGHSGAVAADSLLDMLGEAGASSATEWADEIDVTSIIRALSAKGVQALDESDLALLTALSRKIDVSGRLDVRYSSDWKQSRSPAEVSAVTLRAFAVLLLDSAHALLPGQPALALKRVNTALKVIDLCNSQVEPLRRRAVALLDELLDT